MATAKKKKKVWKWGVGKRERGRAFSRPAGLDDLFQEGEGCRLFAVGWGAWRRVAVCECEGSGRMCTSSILIPPN